MIDIDEFIVPPHGVESFYALLRTAERRGKGSVEIPWRMFGTSDVEKLSDEELLIEKLIWRQRDDHPWGQNRKSIHRPEAVAHCHIHVADQLIKPYKRHGVPIEQACIHHYWTRTAKACLEKRNMSKASNPEFFEALHQVKDETILQYVSTLKTE